MSDEEKKIPIRQQIVDLALTEFSPGRDASGQVYLVDNDGPNVARYGKKAKQALAGKLYDLEGTVAGRTPLDEAWMVIEHGLQAVPKKALPLRVGTDGDNIVIDIGDGTAIVITNDGWKVVERSPITFAQTSATMPLPAPIPGGDIDRLFELINVAPGGQRLVIGWLIAALHQEIAHPVVVLRGQMGSAKSTTAKVIARLIDPTAAPLVTPPKDEDRWDSSCSAHWVVAVDNVSNVPNWLSDSLCRVVTGTGTEKRKLYTDNDVHVASYRRCPILNGISLSGMLRPDLLERSMAFDLEPPTSAERITDATMDARITELLPEVLGGLLDLAVQVRSTEVDVPELPRMADFGLILAKLDVVLGDGPSGFDAYQEQLDELFDESLESDQIALAVIALMNATSTWEGATDDLLTALTGAEKGGDVFWGPKKGEFWPSTATQLGNALRRSAPILAQSGITVESIKVGKNDARKRGKRITRGGRSPGGRVAGVDGSTPYLCFLEKEGEEQRTQVGNNPSTPTDPSTPPGDRAEAKKKLNPFNPADIVRTDKEKS